MNKRCKYHLRPAYDSSELLLEFILADSDTEFGKDFLKTIKEINPTVDLIADLWMNDEVLLHISSDKGTFLLSKDIWGFAFIMAETNPFCIKLIDQILSTSSLFEKEETDDEKYKNLKR